MEFKPIKASDNHIQFKKKITNKEIIRIVHVLMEERLQTDCDIIYWFICEGAQKEITKKKKLEEMKKSNLGYGNS